MVTCQKTRKVHPMSRKAVMRLAAGIVLGSTAAAGIAEACTRAQTDVLFFPHITAPLSRVSIVVVCGLEGSAPITVRPGALLAPADLEAVRAEAEKTCQRSLTDEELAA